MTQTNKDNSKKADATTSIPSATATAATTATIAATKNSALKALGNKDKLFAGDQYPIPFAFNESVAAVFDDMVTRSVPLYEQVTVLSGLWASYYYQAGTYLYDLGCSTGTALEFIGRMLPDGAYLVGVDSAPPMIAKCREKLLETASHHHVTLLEANISQMSWEPCSVVFANYTLQFLPPRTRQAVIQSVYDALVPGGLFLLSEKVTSPYEGFQQTITALYEGFKEAQGYSQTEVARKKQALENVLVPFSESDYVRLLIQAGFVETDSICKWNNFVTLVARKST